MPFKLLAASCNENSEKEAKSGIVSSLETERTHVAKPNYQFEKRQRELEKKKKKAEKALKKTSGADHSADTTEDSTDTTSAADAAAAPDDGPQPND